MSTRINARINPDALIWARSKGNLAIEEMAKAAAVDSGKYQEWEAGESKPTFNQLVGIAKKTKRPLALFYLQQLPAEPPPPRDMRMLAGADRRGLPAKMLIEVRKARYLQDRFEDIVETLGMAWRQLIPSASIEDDPEELATKLRELLGVTVEEQIEWGSPDVAYREWRDRLFDLGCLAIQFSLPQEEGLGFALWNPMVPIVGTNTRRAVGSRNFTLFHEIAHLCLRENAVSDAKETVNQAQLGPEARIEQFCNLVSAAFLLPKDNQAITSLLGPTVNNGQVDINTARTSARKLGVSKYVLLRRLKTLGAITEESFGSTLGGWIKIDEQNVKPKPKGPVAIPRAVLAASRKGRRTADIIVRAYKNNSIGLDEAGSLLELDPKHFSNLERALATKNIPEVDDEGAEG